MIHISLNVHSAKLEDQKKMHLFSGSCLKLDHLPPLRCAIERFLVVAEGGLLATFKRRLGAGAQFQGICGLQRKKSRDAE